LICTGNNISEGVVSISQISQSAITNFIGFIGLNNGDGRGSMDSWWYPNETISGMTQIDPPSLL